MLYLILHLPQTILYHNFSRLPAATITCRSLPRMGGKGGAGGSKKEKGEDEGMFHIYIVLILCTFYNRIENPIAGSAG